MRIVITGGTGSLGQALTKHLCVVSGATVCVVSRDEWKQAQMSEAFLRVDGVHYFLGDVRDRDRLTYAFYGADVVIHAAALKRVDAVAYNPTEVIATNIIGTENVIDAAIAQRVKKVVVVSSDKACEPVNIYGKTKAAAEEVAVSYNSLAAPQGTRISVVRYGNVLTSRGSAYHLFKARADDGCVIPITHVAMTRFAISMEQAVQFVLSVVDHMRGGEIFVPKLPTLRIVDLARAVDPHMPHKVVGLRPGGEKLHESMVSKYEADRTVYDEARGWYIVEPTHPQWGYEHWKEAKPVLTPEQRQSELAIGWQYASDTNDEWLAVKDVRELIERGSCTRFPRAWEGGKYAWLS